MKKINLANRLLADKNPSSFQKEITNIIRRRKKNKQPITYTEQEKNILFKQFKNGSDWAKNELIETTLPLVLKYSREMVNIHGSHNLAVQDIEQQGSLALLDTLDYFNPEKGTFTSCFRTVLKKHYFPFIKRHRKAVRETDPVIAKKKLMTNLANDFYASNGHLPPAGTMINGTKYIEMPDNDVVSLNEPFDNDEDTSYEMQDLLSAPNENMEEKLDNKWLSQFFTPTNNFGLTEFQQKILETVFIKDLEPKNAAEEIGCSITKFKSEYNKLILKIRNIYLKHNNI